MAESKLVTAFLKGKVSALLDEGQSERQISQIVGVQKTAVHRWKIDVFFHFQTVNQHVGSSLAQICTRRWGRLKALGCSRPKKHSNKEENMNRRKWHAFRTLHLQTLASDFDDQGIKWKLRIAQFQPSLIFCRETRTILILKKQFSKRYDFSFNRIVDQQRPLRICWITAHLNRWKVSLWFLRFATVRHTPYTCSYEGSKIDRNWLKILVVRFFWTAL